jgi:hypothetical protein
MVQAAKQVETWVCVQRAGEFAHGAHEKIIITEDVLHAMAASFTGAIPINTGFLPFDTTPDPRSLTGATLQRVEVRRDDQGPYLAGPVSRGARISRGSCAPPRSPWLCA